MARKSSKQPPGATDTPKPASSPGRVAKAADGKFIGHPPQLWHDVKQAYLQGMSRIEIVERFPVTYGALNARISREKWKAQQKKVKMEVARKDAVALTTLGEQVKSKAGEDINSAIEALTSIGMPSNVSKIGQRVDVLGKIVSVGNTIFGWDKEDKAQASGVNVNLLVCNAPKPQIDEETEVIDVEELIKAGLKG